MATKKKTAKKTSGKPTTKKAAARAKAIPKSKPKTKAKSAPARRAAGPRTKPGAVRIAEVSPSFTVNDLKQSIAFYTNVLGFTVTNRWEWEGELRGVELSAGATSFMLGQDDWQKGRDRQKGVGFRVYCTTTQDVDALAEAIKAKGGALDDEPRTEQWGRFFSFADPDGFKLTIVNEKIKR